MKTVLILAGLVALAAGSFPLYKDEHVATKKLDEKLVELQYEVLSLFENVAQVYNSEFYTIGKEYDIEKNIDKYHNTKAVHSFLSLWRVGITPKFYLFSIFQEKQREEAVLVYELFYSAKDFDTLYKTAAWAKVHLNEGQFFYAFYTALLHRVDTRGIVLPSPYELWPEYFVNMEAMYRMVSTQLLSGVTIPEEFSYENGYFKEGNTFYYHYNYSDSMSYDNNEHKLAYFTEDIGWNAYYYYFHVTLPFWSSGEEILGPFKERRGEYYYFFYQQLLARYYLERLSNGLGEIPKFSWHAPLKAGYYPYLSKNFYPFAQRCNHYFMGTPENYESIQFVDMYEKSFLHFIQLGQFKAFNQEVDFRNSKSMNFVGNYWQENSNLYEKEGKPRNYYRSYEQVARRLLGAAPPAYDDYRFIPTALDFYQTSMRDPVFYQLYGKIMNYIVEYKESLEPYTHDDLHYVGVKINDIKVDELVTFFEYYDFNVTKAMYFPTKDATGSHNFVVRQPRLNHKPFSVTFDIKSDIESEVAIKLFMAPKYDGEDRPLTLDDNWMNFIELDWFTYKLTSGQNKVVRKSEEFFTYKEDSVSTKKIFDFLKQGVVPKDMSDDYYSMPSRLMLPRGTNGGFPVQFFAFVYPYKGLTGEYESMKQYVLDHTPFGYPFDRPISVPQYFYQPNMYFKDVYVYQHGPEYPWWNEHIEYLNSVPKH